MSANRKGILQYDRKKGDWYFDGYERKVIRDEDGKDRKTFVYKGEYYHFGLGVAGLSRLKAAFAGLLIVYIAVFLYFSASPFAANNIPYVGIPTILIIPPLIYLTMGIICLCVAKPEMTIRSMYGSIRRIRRSLVFAIPLNAIVCIGNTVFLLLNRHDIEVGQELQALIGSILCLTALAAMAVLLKLYPCRSLIKREPKKS